MKTKNQDYDVETKLNNNVEMEDDLDFDILKLLDEIDEELGLTEIESSNVIFNDFDDFEEYDEYDDIESLYEVQDYLKNYDSYEGSYEY